MIPDLKFQLHRLDQAVFSLLDERARLIQEMGTPAACTADQKGFQCLSANAGSPQADGSEQARIALWPIPTARSTSFTHSFTSQNGMAATGIRRLGSALHQSTRKSL